MLITSNGQFMFTEKFNAMVGVYTGKALIESNVDGLERWLTVACNIECVIVEVHL